MSSRTLCSRSVKGRKSISPAARPASGPRLSVRRCRIESLVIRTEPHSVWWITTISRVPSISWETAIERTTSIVGLPPELRRTCTSPSASPRARSGSIRASMQVSTTSLWRGGIGRSPFVNCAAYRSLAAINSGTIDIGGVTPASQAQAGTTPAAPECTEPKSYPAFSGAPKTRDTRCRMALRRCTPILVTDHGPVTARFKPHGGCGRFRPRRRSRSPGHPCAAEARP